MKKNKQAPLLSRWWHYKYSGLLTFAPIIILSVVGYIYMVEQQEFFTAWSCDTLEDYLLDKNVPDEYPSHNDITDEQHIRLHTIYQECVDNTSFLSPHA